MYYALATWHQCCGTSDQQRLICRVCLKLIQNISTLAQSTCNVLLQILAHPCAEGNKTADQLVKGREKEPPPSHLSDKQTKIPIHNKKEWHLPEQNWRTELEPRCSSANSTTPTDHHFSPQNRPMHTVPQN